MNLKHQNKIKSQWLQHFTPSGSSDFKEEVSEAVNNPEADALKHELEASQEQLNKAMEALKQTTKKVDGS